MSKDERHLDAGPAVEPSSPARPDSTPRPSRRIWAGVLSVPVAAAVAGSAVGLTINRNASDSPVQPPIDAADPVDLGIDILEGQRSLDGSGNNLDDPTLGQAGELYPRVAEANYADAEGEMVEGPDERYLSNRIFNDTNQNIFSENGVTHWGFVWGQFLDHTIGLREVGEEELLIGFDPTDPLEDFTNDLGTIATTRSAAADGSGIDGVPREQTNIVSSYIDAWAIYGGTDERLDWLRDGTVDGDPTNNEATLLQVDGYLPAADERDGAEAPTTDLMGRLFADPESAVIAGDVRVNENIGLTAVQTLFVREHNRIVAALPDVLDEETKFQIARRVVGAEQQYITYTEFLPAMGVSLDPYTGYDANVDPSISNEFATVGYRAHSQIHGEFEAEIPAGDVDAATLVQLETQGVEVDLDEATGIAEVAIPLNVAFGNPGLLQEIGLGNFLTGLTSESAYANDGQIDNQLRSVLFQIPGPATENPLDCLDGEAIAECFSGVNDLGSLDVARAYDHGMPSYNDLRVAYGLTPVSSFTDLTGESTDDLGGLSIDDPSILDIVYLEDGAGNELEIGSDSADTQTVVAERRTTVASRLAALFGNVDDVDAFTGMVSEPHVEGTEFGELQLAMWTTQFEALRDGDRFFYGNDPMLEDIAATYGIDFQRGLSDLIADNTDADLDELPANAFVVGTTQSTASNESAEAPVETPAVAEGAASVPTEDASDTTDNPMTPDEEVPADRRRAADRGNDDRRRPGGRGQS